MRLIKKSDDAEAVRHFVSRAVPAGGALAFATITIQLRCGQKLWRAGGVGAG